MDEALDPDEMSYWVRNAYDAIVKAVDPASELSGYDQRIAILKALNDMQSSMDNDLY